jgi:hypothetical protein
MINIITTKLLPEFEYSCHVIFKEWLSIDYRLSENNNIKRTQVILPNGSYIEVDNSIDKLLSVATINEYVQFSLVKNDYIVESDIPVLHGYGVVDRIGNKISISTDIFATCFLMISRLEETLQGIALDDHKRFPATESIAYKYGFLERPIADEYVEMLWNMMIDLDSSLTRKKRDFKKFITCDVDWPFDPIRYSLKQTILSSTADLIKRKSIPLAVCKWKNYLCNLLGIDCRDDNRDNISWIMDVNEKAGNKVAFYFITFQTSNFDSKFNFDSKEMRDLFQEINTRGHELGLHPGYHCFNDSEHFQNSSIKLKSVLKEENINQKILGGRMHILRWDPLITPTLWDENGFDYDSTLIFAEQSGFRCGTCQEYSMFDLLSRKPLKLKQRPLINMECTIIEERYEGLGETQSAELRFMQFMAICEKFNGTYTLLWHNTNFPNDFSKKIYRNLL